MELNQIQEDIARLNSLIDRQALEEKLQELDAQLNTNTSWNDYTALQKVQQEHKHISQTLEDLTAVEQTLKHLQELTPLVADDSTGELRVEFTEEQEKLSVAVSELLIRAQFTGAFDRNDAVLTIRVGQGGTDAQDWVEMLSRMYLKYAQKHEWKVDVLDQQYGAEAGLTDITLEVTGLFAYGYLQGEKGIHRLVRISPFNAGGTRETSFASVEVIPQFDHVPTEITINDGDLELKTFRASGPGGQHTNKSSTAIQIMHKPSGIVVRCSTQRSQIQNREKALEVLKNKLWIQAEEARQQQQQALKGEKQTASWGQQTRNYVLHPYQLVKDLRTGKETSQVQAVLEGELDLLRK